MPAHFKVSSPAGPRHLWTEIPRDKVESLRPTLQRSDHQQTSFRIRRNQHPLGMNCAWGRLMGRVNYESFVKEREDHAEEESGDGKGDDHRAK
jgi:hypothetical protein